MLCCRGRWSWISMSDQPKRLFTLPKTGCVTKQIFSRSRESSWNALAIIRHPFWTVKQNVNDALCCWKMSAPPSSVGDPKFSADAIVACGDNFGDTAAETNTMTFWHSTGQPIGSHIGAHDTLATSSFYLSTPWSPHDRRHTEDNACRNRKDRKALTLKNCYCGAIIRMWFPQFLPSSLANGSVVININIHLSIGERHAQGNSKFVCNWCKENANSGNLKEHGMKATLDYSGSTSKSCKIVSNTQVCQSKIKPDGPFCKIKQGFLGLFMIKGLLVIFGLSSINVRIACTNFDRSSKANFEM